MTDDIVLSRHDLERIAKTMKAVSDLIGDPVSETATDAWDMDDWRWGIEVHVDSDGYRIGSISVNPDGWWQFHQKSEK